MVLGGRYNYFVATVAERSLERENVLGNFNDSLADGKPLDSSALAI